MAEFPKELVKTLLLQLLDYQKLLAPGDVIIVQPLLDGMPVTNTVRAEGHNWDVIDRCLRWMLTSGLISSGSVETHPGIGIHFCRITEQGRTFMSRNSTTAAI